MKIHLRKGLPFISATVFYRGNRLILKNIGSLGVAVIRYTDYADLTDLHGFFY